MDFGFTNDKEQYDAAIAFRKDAVKDGWSIKPTYITLESIDRASTLEKEGFKCSILTRTNIGKWKYQASVAIWGSDGMVISAPFKYDWNVIKAGLRRCNTCKKEDVDVFCVGFAGRVCKECLPEQRKKHEYPGWTN